MALTPLASWRGRGLLSGMSVLATAVAVVAAIVTARAAQAWGHDPDVIELDGEVSEIDAIGIEPLEDRIRKEQLRQLKEDLQALEQGRPEGPRCAVTGKGYKAHWHVRDGELQLVRVVIDPCLDLGKPFDVREFGRYGESPARAHGYTGHVIVPRGQPIGEVDGEPQHRTHVVLIVQRGQVLSRTVIGAVR